jgi:hypothetical protein
MYLRTDATSSAWEGDTAMAWPRRGKSMRELVVGAPPLHVQNLAPLRHCTAGDRWHSGLPRKATN